MKHAVLAIVAVGVLAAALSAQVQLLRIDDWRPFDRRYPAGKTWGVVVRGDLPAIGVNGFDGSDRGKAHVAIDVTPDGWWKAATGLFGKDQPTSGPLTRGEIVQLSAVDTKPDAPSRGSTRVDLRFVSVEGHDIVLNVRHRQQKRREQIGILLRIALANSFSPFLPSSERVVMALDPYVRLFSTLDAARAFARTLDTPQPDRRFSVAVLRRDGILIPFASVDDGHWFRRWPTPTAEREVPIGFAGIPRDWWGLEGPAADWTLWPDAGLPVPLRALGAIGFGAHCQMQVGLRTDYQSSLPMPPLEQHHYPKDGLAVNGNVTVERIEVGKADSPLWTSLEQLLKAYLKGKEDWTQVLNARERPTWREWQDTPVKLEVLCLAAGAAPGWITGYFEASKRYPPPADATAPSPCGPVTFVSGWVHSNEAHVATFDVRTTVALTDCTQWNITFRKPFGVIRIDGTPVWFLQASQWGREGYEVVRVERGRVVPLMSVTGGWCSTIGS